MSLVVSAFPKSLTHKALLAALLAAALFWAETSVAASKHFLDSFDGSWRGKGFIITSDGGKEEAIRCRLRNRSDSKKGKLTINGTCGIGGVVIPMNGWIQEQSKSRRYVASLFKSLAFLRIDSFAGKLSGKKLRLNFKGLDRTSKAPISASVVLHARNKKSFNIQLSSTDPNTKRRFNVGTIKFAAR